MSLSAIDGSFDHFAEAAMHIEAVVGVADLFIKAGEKNRICLVKMSPAVQPVDDLRFCSVTCRALIFPSSALGYGPGRPITPVCHHHPLSAG